MQCGSTYMSLEKGFIIQRSVTIKSLWNTPIGAIQRFGEIRAVKLCKGFLNWIAETWHSALTQTHCKLQHRVNLNGCKLKMSPKFKESQDATQNEMSLSHCIALQKQPCEREQEERVLT